MKIFYDVDTQNDFMNKDGALYLPGAEEIKPNLKRLTDYAAAKNIPKMGSKDRHYPTDPELAAFPPHCMDGTYGQQKIPETDGSAGMYFEKQAVDIFTNPAFEHALRENAVSEAVVYGVATDFCVEAAVLGMQKRGIQCYVVEDAIQGVFPDMTQNALEEMVQSGAKLVKTEDVLEGKV